MDGWIEILSFFLALKLISGDFCAVFLTLDRAGQDKHEMKDTLRRCEAFLPEKEAATFASICPFAP